MVYPKKTILALLTSIACMGCFQKEAPPRDVVATNMAEATSLGDKVTFLDFSQTAGIESFPENLGKYPALRRLSLRGCSAVSGIPESVVEAKVLYELDVSETGVKDFPKEIEQLSSLRNLYVSGNKITDFPAAISALSNLRYLNLDRNSLTNLPPSIGNMKALKWVRLNNNAITSLPEECANWSDIRRLYLRGNGLTEFPAVILKMTSLEELDLGDNDLESIPEEICNLPNLHRIDLDGNQKLAKLPESLSRMPQLTHLFVFRCNLSTTEQQRIRQALGDPVRHFIAF